METSNRKISRGSRVLFVLLMSFMMLAGAMICDLPESYAASAPAPTATAAVTAPKGAYLRKTAKMSGKKLTFAYYNRRVTVLREVFTTKKSTSSKKRWYLVTYNGKTGYIRADWLGKFSYSTTPAKTTAKLAYRSGAGNKMKKKGTFTKGASINVLLESKASGSSAKWYKVQKGSSTYFVSSKYVKLTPPVVPAPAPKPAPQTNNTQNNNQNNTNNAAQQVASVVASQTSGSGGTPQFTLTDIRYPESLGESLPFSIMGKITCNLPIEKAVVKICNSGGTTVMTTSVNGTGNTLDIKSLDAGIKFGQLTPGSYKYYLDVYVGGKCYNKINHSFSVRKLTWPDKIANTAISLAWPAGTDEAAYTYGTGAATDAFNNALNSVYPDRSRWGEAPQVGASCDVFVGTAVRASGYDSAMPRGLGDMSSGQWAHLNNSSLWQEIPYSYKESDLRNGDIIIYQRYSGSEHVCIYVKINGKGYLAEAAIKTYYGHLSKLSSGSKIFKSSDKKKFKVYRATN